MFYLFERQNHCGVGGRGSSRRERTLPSADLLVHSPHGHTGPSLSQAEACSQNSFSFLYMGRGSSTWAISFAFLGTLAGSWIQRRAAKTPMGTLTWDASQHSRLRFSSLHPNAGPCDNHFKYSTNCH